MLASSEEVAFVSVQEEDLRHPLPVAIPDSHILCPLPLAHVGFPSSLDLSLPELSMSPLPPSQQTDEKPRDTGLGRIHATSGHWCGLLRIPRGLPGISV